MNKEKNNARKKWTWKSWLLVCIPLFLAVSLPLTFCHYEFDAWLVTVLFPLLFGTLASAAVALYFTVKTDREQLYDRLSREIVAVIEKSMKLIEELHVIAISPIYPDNLKKAMLHRTLISRPEMYAIRDHYRELWKLYGEKTDYISVEIEAFPENEFVTQFMEKRLDLKSAIVEIMECALKTQDQFLQDFKKIPKGPIENKLIHVIGTNKASS